MSIQGVNRGGAYFAVPSAVPFAAQGAPDVSHFSAPSIPPGSYAKVDQNCGLQGCFFTVCRKIIEFMSCLFKTLCCCCEEEKTEERVPGTRERLDNNLSSVNESGQGATSRVGPLFAKSTGEVTKSSDLDLSPVPILDITLKIFSHCEMETGFPNLAPVCKTWHRVVKGIYIDQLGCKKSLSMKELFLYQKRLGGAEKELVRVRRANQEELEISSGDWKCVFEHCKRLEALNFSEVFSATPHWEKNWQRQEQEAKEIVLITKTAAALCPHFKILDFSKCMQLLLPSGIDDLIQEALGHVPQLTCLNLWGSSAPLVLVHAFVQKLPELVSLRFDTTGLFWQDLPMRRTESIAKIGELCPNLQRLNFQILMDGKYEAKDISILTEKFPNLTHLSIGAEVASEGWEILAKGCENLVFFQFVFQDARKIDQSAIPENMLHECIKVDEALDTFSKKWPKIKISLRLDHEPRADFFLGNK